MGKPALQNTLTTLLSSRLVRSPTPDNAPVKAHLTQRVLDPIDDVRIVDPNRAPVAAGPTHCAHCHRRVLLWCCCSIVRGTCSRLKAAAITSLQRCCCGIVLLLPWLSLLLTSLLLQEKVLDFVMTRVQLGSLLLRFAGHDAALLPVPIGDRLLDHVGESVA